MTGCGADEASRSEERSPLPLLAAQTYSPPLPPPPPPPLSFDHFAAHSDFIDPHPSAGAFPMPSPMPNPLAADGTALRWQRIVVEQI
jgi:hypothetical protein